jgi:tRNA(fMet)-specific endonuclease VapC
MNCNDLAKLFTVVFSNRFSNGFIILEKQGKPIGNNDLWIASHALAIELVLGTNNEREFSRILKLDRLNIAENRRFRQCYNNHY